MDEATANPELQEALATLRRYLEDLVHPLEAMEAVKLILSHPPGTAASEICAWASVLHRRAASNRKLSDYLFDGIRKLHAMRDLQLLPEAPLEEFLESLRPSILRECPAAERESLEKDLGALGKTGFAPQSTHRLPPERVEAGAPLMREPPAVYGGDPTGHDPDVAVLPVRVGKAAPNVPESVIEAGSESTGQALAALTRQARSDSDLRESVPRPAGFGADRSTEQLFRSLGGSLPGWVLCAQSHTGTGQPITYVHPQVEAIRHVVLLAKSSRETAKRIRELVEAAIDQFNHGALPQAAAMIDLAEDLIRDRQIDRTFLSYTRSNGHRMIDSDRLRSLVENPANGPLLRKVLGFFDEMRPAALLEQLATETRRNHRRLLLNLLEAYADAARSAASRLLEQRSVGAEQEDDWHLLRNLVYLLHRIPPGKDQHMEQEVDRVAGMLARAIPSPLAKEIVTYLGQIRRPTGEKALIEFAEKLETVLTDGGQSPHEAAILCSLLDRAVQALARHGTRHSVRTVVAHTLRTEPELGETLARAAYLSGQDLSGFEELVEEIINVLHAMLPHKVLGVTVQKDLRDPTPLIKALASTRSPAAQQLLRETAAKHPDQQFGRAAAKILHDIEEDSGNQTKGCGRILGDLPLFGLPDILRRLAGSQADGTLTLRDIAGKTMGILSFSNGRLVRCVSENLSAAGALYMLFEKPKAGTFLFAPASSQEAAEAADAAMPRELEPLIVEGMRRYDEYQVARAVVPDTPALRAAGSEPDFAPADEEPALCREVWHKTCSGMPPIEIEKSVAVDPLRIRRILARWLEEGSLS